MKILRRISGAFYLLLTLISFALARAIDRNASTAMNTPLDNTKIVTTHDKHTDLCSKATDQGIFVHLHESLNNYHSELKEFINYTHFDDLWFDNSSIALRSKLSFLEFAIADIGSCDYKLLLKLKFLKYMFESMVSDSGDLKAYGPGSGSGEQLIQKVLELNVRLLALYGSIGIPNGSLRGFGDTVHNLSRLLMKWGKEFRRLRFTQRVLIRKFKHEYARAESSLASLRLHSIRPSIPDR